MGKSIIDGFVVGIFFILALVCIFLLTSCGSGGDTAGGNGGGNPPVVVNALAFSCLDVDNDQTCEAELDAAGIFNSGDVRISGSPMPQDYFNLEIESTLALSADVFIWMNVEISGCVDQALAFDIVTIDPGETVTFSDTLWGFRCGSVAYNETVATIYNTGHFNPWDYPSVYDYPRDQAIANAVVRWHNVGGG